MGTIGTIAHLATRHYEINRYICVNVFYLLSWCSFFVMCDNNFSAVILCSYNSILTILSVKFKDSLIKLTDFN